MRILVNCDERGSSDLNSMNNFVNPLNYSFSVRIFVNCDEDGKIIGRICKVGRKNYHRLEKNDRQSSEGRRNCENATINGVN